jgi:hypothetical protein
MCVCVIILLILFIILSKKLIEDVPSGDFPAVLRLIIVTWFTIIMILTISLIGISMKGNIMMNILTKSSNVTTTEKDGEVTDFYFTYNEQEYHFKIAED